MKKILYSFFLFTLGLPIVASAATFSFSPSTNSFAPGDTFDVTISVNPKAGEEITVAKLSAQFPADILEVVSFSQATGWMSPTSGEFDSLDNTAGTFTKMAGFPARVTELKEFGTVTLKTKAVGIATINAGDGSMILDITNSDKYIVSSGATFTIVAPAPEPIKEPQKEIKTTTIVEKTPVAETVSITQEEEVVKEVAKEDVKEDDVLVQENKNTSNLAAVSEVGEGFFTTKNIGFSLAFIVLVILGIFFLKKKE